MSSSSGTPAVTVTATLPLARIDFEHVRLTAIVKHDVAVEQPGGLQRLDQFGAKTLEPFVLHDHVTFIGKRGTQPAPRHDPLRPALPAEHIDVEDRLPSRSMTTAGRLFATTARWSRAKVCGS